MRKTIDDLLQEARSRLVRLEPREAATAVADGALLVDIRSDAQRRAQGVLAGALWCERNVLEWRLDPDSAYRDPRVGGLDRQVIVICAQGYQSSLAAANLQELGFERATDVDGGFEAWAAAGLPFEREPADGSTPASVQTPSPGEPR